MKAIELEGLSFSYGKGKRIILDGISLSCEQGTVNALIGLNGSGKTTLIKVMAGLETQSSGTVRYSGRDISEMTFKERSKVLAYVRQNYGSLSDYSVKDYLLFGTVNRLDLFDTPDRKEIDAVEKVVDQFDIGHLYDKKLGELSGGERQIISICSAMVQDSEVVLLDEPCSALDIVNQNKVLSILNSRAEDSNKTILFSTHNPNHALYTKATVFLLNNGRIADCGPAEEIVTPERLKCIYGEGVCYSRDQPYDEISFRQP